MKRVLFAVLLLLVCQVSGAQKVYFIYIQSESNSPFFVKMGDKVSSSTASGYLIIPKLVDSVYTFMIGKPGQTAAESRFSVTINKKDKGFVLREADDKISLFDLQSLTLLQPLASATPSGEPVAKRSDAFTVLLAQAANDPSLLEIRTVTTAVQTETKKQPEPSTAVAVAAKEPEATETKELGKEEQQAKETITDKIVQEVLRETAPAAPSETAKADEAKPDITNVNVTKDTAQHAVTTTPEPAQTALQEEAQPYKRSVVTRKSESSTTEGFGLVFLDEAEGAVDTIRILIPNQNLSVKKEENDDGDSKKFLDITTTDTTKAAVTVEAANDKISAAKKRSGCNLAATDKDFLKLRKNMSAKKSDDAMIGEAQKAFKKACFSTEQIKSLSSLFLSAGGKYHFFDAAYGHVSDQEQYAVLQTELNDAYYVNRFKALIAKQ